MVLAVLVVTVRLLAMGTEVLLMLLKLMILNIWSCYLHAARLSELAICKAPRMHCVKGGPALDAKTKLATPSLRAQCTCARQCTQ